LNKLVSRSRRRQHLPCRATGLLRDVPPSRAEAPRGLGQPRRGHHAGRRGIIIIINIIVAAVRRWVVTATAEPGRGNGRVPGETCAANVRQGARRSNCRYPGAGFATWRRAGPHRVGRRTRGVASSTSTNEEPSRAGKEGGHSRAGPCRDTTAGRSQTARRAPGRRDISQATGRHATSACARIAGASKGRAREDSCAVAGGGVRRGHDRAEEALPCARVAGDALRCLRLPAGAAHGRAKASGPSSRTWAVVARDASCG